MHTPTCVRAHVSGLGSLSHAEAPRRFAEELRPYCFRRQGNLISIAGAVPYAFSGHASSVPAEPGGITTVISHTAAFCYP